MSETKIQVKVGIIEFSGEGNQDWLSAQLDKILEKAPELLKIGHAFPKVTKEVHTTSEKDSKSEEPVISKPTNFPAFLKEKGATTNQTKKFLATAAFIQLNGKDRLMTSEISSLLSKSNQSKIGNPSDKLNKNVGKGFCTKEGNSFYVTPEGFKDLSIDID